MSYRFACLGALLLAVLAAALPAPAAAAKRPPNIVFVLADDLSWDLIRHMPQVRKLQRHGMTFDQFIVSDSMCCPSRATILTGQFPHSTKVLTNTPPDGGYSAWAQNGARRRSVGLALQRSGYRTGMIGKFLNGYWPSSHPVDPGWDDWLATSGGYSGFNYWTSDNGQPVLYGSEPADYLTDVLARRAATFIEETDRRQPFFLQINTVAPHRPAVAAIRHRHMFRWLKLPKTGSLNAQTKNPPTWLGKREAFDADRMFRLRRKHRRRARSVQALDGLVSRVRATLRREGLGKNTYVMFSSDNGYHLGQHRLTFGKRTAFDHDIRVPLIVAGPGIRRGSMTDALTGTVDLAPTFEAMAGLRPDRRRHGRSLVPILRRQPLARWRRAMLIEHTERGARAGDPDQQGWAMGIPPTYRALRTARTTYVEYANGDREFYDRRRDPDELANRAHRLRAEHEAALHRTLKRYRRCKRARQCWIAGRADDLPSRFG